MELATGLAPFHDLQPAAVSMKIISNESPLDYALQNCKSQQLQLLNKECQPENDVKAIIGKCLSISRHKRPSAEEIVCDSFFQDVELPNF